MPGLERATSIEAASLVLALLLVAPVSSLAQPLDLECLLEPKTSVTVSAPIEGVVESMLVKRGDRVTQGQVLATLEASVEKAALETARIRAKSVAAFRRNEARLGLAERTLDRSKALEQGGVLAMRDRDEAESEKAMAEAGLLEARETQKLARADVERARAVLELRTIRSPIDGIVVERLLSPGDLADPPQLVELVEIDPLHVEVFAPLSAWGRIDVGSEADVTLEDPVGGTYPATVAVVDHVVDAASGTFRVRLELPNPENALPAGLKCMARLPTSAGSDRLAASEGDAPLVEPTATDPLAAP
jgi:RND family efflux transporter MFP subunit